MKLSRRLSRSRKSTNPNSFGQRLRAWSAWRWFTPGIGVKRWIGLLILGVTLIALGLAYVVIDIYRNQPLPDIFYYITLQFIPHIWRGVLVGGFGLAAIAIALIRISRSILAPFMRPGDKPMAEIVYRHYQRERGLKVVAIGGGTGLSIFLRGIKAHTSNITAIITVADDGGSSGRLRRELGVLPPGDFRNCLAALADDESLTTQLFQYRFAQGEGLDGHAFGNLFITAMAEVSGSFERGLIESSRVLAITGRILPSTLNDVSISAEVKTDQGLIHVEGESAITHAHGSIERVTLKPADARPYPETIRAILDADLIILGPGSLYTSILPNLLINSIPDALRASKALKLYVCNVATQHGETDSYSILDHAKAIEKHIGPNVIDAVIANSRLNIDWVNPPDGVGNLIQAEASTALPIISADVVDETRPWRHDSQKLARAVINAYNTWRVPENRASLINGLRRRLKYPDKIMPITRREFLKLTGLTLTALALPNSNQVFSQLSVSALLWYYARDAWNNVVYRNRQRAMLSSHIYPKATFVRDSFYGPLALNDAWLGYECYRWFERTQDQSTGQIRTAVPFLAENELLFPPQDDDSSLLFIPWSMWLKRHRMPIDQVTVERAFDFVKTHVHDDWFVSPAGPFRYWADTVAPERDERITHNQGLYVLALRSMIELGWGGVTDRDLAAARSNYAACYRSDFGAFRLGLDSWWNDKLDISTVFPEFMLRYLFNEAALPDDLIRSTVDHILGVASVYKDKSIGGVKVICANDGSFLPPEKFFADVLNRPGDYQNGGYWPMYTLIALALRYKIEPSVGLRSTIEQLVRAELAIDHRSKEIIIMIPGQVGLSDPNRSGYTWNALIGPALRWAKVA